MNQYTPAQLQSIADNVRVKMEEGFNVVPTVSQMAYEEWQENGKFRRAVHVSYAIGGVKPEGQVMGYEPTIEKAVESFLTSWKEIQRDKKGYALWWRDFPLIHEDDGIDCVYYPNSHTTQFQTREKRGFGVYARCAVYRIEES